MKANEFVKMVGWEEAKGILEAESFTYRQLGLFSYISHDLDYLKRLVESHELVEQYNGLFEAKELIRVSPKLTSELREVAAAIADVESCQ